MTGRWRVRLLGLLIVVMVCPARRALPDDGYRLDLPPALRNAWPAGYDPANARWLPAHQMPDGHWPALGPGESGTPHDLTATGLSLCAFLGAGYNPQGKHPFARVVRRGLGWLRRRQAASGCFARARDPDLLIGHAVATLAMTEAYGMTDSVLLRDSAVPALAHLLSGQAANGAWKQPGTSRDDPLATFWAALPLKSAQLINKGAVQAGRKPPIPQDVGKALARIAAWFGRRTDAATGIVRALDERERRRGATTLVLTAAGALLRVYAGEDPGKDKGSLRAALEHLAANPPSPDRSRPAGDGLYIYIGTLASFQAGGKVWETWKQALERGVVRTQIRKGTAFDRKGSWDPAGAFATTRGRLTMTTLMSLALEVFYRYDKVFGADPGDAPPTGAMAPTLADTATSQSHALKLEVHARTWKRSSLPVHSARMKLAEGGSLPIDAAHLRAEVHGTRAQVVLDLFVTNPHKALTEGVLDLRLPDGAAPYYLAFGGAELAKVPLPGAGGVVGTDLASLHGASKGTWGAMREARMAPVTKATTAFETIVRQRKDPALLTWSGAGMFHLRVFPLEPGKQHRITVGYEVDLTPVGDDAELRLALPRAVHDLRVAVCAPGATWSTLPKTGLVNDVRTWHEPATDVIRVVIAKPGPTFLVGRAADGSQHTAAWIQPELPEIPRVASTRAQFLIDVSQSVGADYVQIWRALVPAILEQNRDQLKSFSVGFFDVRTNWWRDGFVENTPTNVAALRKALDVIEAGGATDVAQALRSARERAEPMDLFLFTDGVTTWGDPTTEGIRADRPVFAYAAGLGERRGLLEDIAEQSGGALVHVLGAADIAAAARAHRFEPWTLQALALPGVSDILIAGDPRRIYPGQHLRLAGRGRLEAGGKLFLRLRHGEREVTVRQAIPTLIESPMAARAYGQAGVERLEAAGSDVGRLATDYAIHYRVVRKSAALVMLESAKDYARFGLDKTGHAKRVAARPVLTALAALPPRPTDAAAKFSPLAFARSRNVPEPLVRILRTAPAHMRSAPPTSAATPPEATLRSLSSVLDRGKATTRELRTLALHIHGLGLPGHAAGALLFTKARDPIADWLMARAAVAAGRPVLALAAYEAALGSADNEVSDEVLWIIAADYERHLARASAAAPPAEVKAFIRARAASLRAWRDRMRVHAPSRQAALVVLHVPYDRRDRASIEVRGSEAITIPQERYDNDLRMTALPTLPKGTWSLRLVRGPSDQIADDHAGRSLVIVIRDWGHPSERVSFARSIEPDAAGTPIIDSAR